VGDQRTDTVVATVHARSEPLDVAADPQAKTICVTGNGDNTVAVLATCRGTSSRPLPVAAERKHRQVPNPRPGR
jgi:DNA-binding beta-propeller fold protein YncE